MWKEVDILYVRRTMYVVQLCTLYDVHLRLTMYVVQCTPYSVSCLLHYIQCTSVNIYMLCVRVIFIHTPGMWCKCITVSKYVVWCTTYSVRTLYVVQCTVYNIYCTTNKGMYDVYLVLCLTYSVRRTMYIIHCTSYNIRRT